MVEEVDHSLNLLFGFALGKSARASLLPSLLSIMFLPPVHGLNLLRSSPLPSYFLTLSAVLYLGLIIVAAHFNLMKRSS